MPRIFQVKEKYGIQDLLEIMRILRSPEGCPWDREQTHQSIRTDFLEETHEALEAINNGDAEALKEELGDVLFAAVKAARFAGVDPEAAIAATCEKFIRRFRAVEEGAAAQGRAVSDLSRQEMLALYDASKRS